jgi:hypothetical protein
VTGWLLKIFYSPFGSTRGIQKCLGFSWNTGWEIISAAQSHSTYSTLWSEYLCRLLVTSWWMQQSSGVLCTDSLCKLLLGYRLPFSGSFTLSNRRSHSTIKTHQDSVTQKTDHDHLLTSRGHCPKFLAAFISKLLERLNWWTDLSGECAVCAEVWLCGCHHLFACIPAEIPNHFWMILLYPVTIHMA